MNVNIAVCGRFHYHNYIRYIDQAGLLNRFYYSHKRSTDAAFLGIERDRAVNLWAKEYLIRLHGRLTRGWLAQEFARLYADLWQISALRRWERCDILHLMLHGTGRKLIRRAKDEGAKVIVEPVNQHPVGMNATLDEEAERLGLKRVRRLFRIQERQIEESLASDFLLAPSRIVRDSYIDRGYDVSRSAVLPYGVDLNRFHPLAEQAKPDKTFRVICVAQISPRKGQLYLLEAWETLALPNAELLLIGALSYEMAALLDRYAGWFRHVPFVPNHRLIEYYGQSSVFVLPSLEDGFAVVIGEAMACGLPVITTYNTGAADIVTHGRDGFVVPIRSPEAIAEHLELLYRNRELRDEMSRAALTKAQAELGWDIYAHRLCDLYRSLLAGETLSQSLTENRAIAGA
ncbi:MAG: glycosyltransferase family 4 protein [Candidatus Binataceae bacterium]|nr:glycosyltransferase family 4 protein [Candidatus Binataceae bacterium]